MTKEEQGDKREGEEQVECNVHKYEEFNEYGKERGVGDGS